LETDDELHAIHHRHADYFTQLFDGSERDWHTQRTDAWLQRGSVEIDNVRVALNWAIVHDPDTALRLAREFAWIWFMSGAYLEAEHWLDRALARSGDVPDDLRADAQWWIGAYATTRGAYLKAHLALGEALAVHLDLNNETRAARCLHGLGRIAMYAGDLDEAVKLYESALELFGQHFDPSMTVTLINLGVALLSNGELERAAAAFDEAMGLAERDGLGWHRAQILDGRGRLAVAAGDLALARRNLKGSMELNRDAQDPRFVAQALESCAWLAIVEGSTAHAARLLGAVSRIRESIGVPVPPSIQFDYDRYFPVAQAQLSPADWLRAWAEGRALSQADAIEVALQGLL
jgi:tetratricopeptide (TPR) repeat protein